MEVVEDLNIYGEWQRGKVAGWIKEGRTSYSFHVGKPERTWCFSVADYVDDADDEHGAAALRACKAFQYKYCKDNGLLRNEWREATTPTTGDKWLQFRINGGFIANCDLCDKDAVEAYTWGTRSLHKSPRPGRSIRLANGKPGMEFFHNHVTGNTMTDHWDGNGLNNRRANLFQTTKTLNARNMQVNIRNTSGMTGVKEYEKEWRAYWCDSTGKSRQKSFAIKKYGYKTAEKMAMDMRKEKEKELNIRVRTRTTNPVPHETPKRKRVEKEESGIIGVVDGGLCWRTYWRDSLGVCHWKTFSKNKYGDTQAKAMAAAVYQAADKWVNVAPLDDTLSEPPLKKQRTNTLTEWLKTA